MINLDRTLERRSVLSWPIFGLSLAALIGAANAAAAGPALPTGGIVAAGSAVIASPAGGTLTINQSSSRAIINWSSFSIGQAGAVQLIMGRGRLSTASPALPGRFSTASSPARAAFI